MNERWLLAVRFAAIIFLSVVYIIYIRYVSLEI